MLIVIKADKANIDVRSQIAEIFADGFTQWLTYFSKDKDVIAKAFAHMFVLEYFYIALSDDKVVGVAACTDCQNLSVQLDKKELKKHLGFIKGTLATLFLKKEFEAPFENPTIETGSIEFVGTASKFQGQGVASKIISHIIETTPYKQYLIKEVADTNIPAMNLYQKLGFKEYMRIPVPRKKAKKIGINNFIGFKLIKFK